MIFYRYRYLFTQHNCCGSLASMICLRFQLIRSTNSTASLASHSMPFEVLDSERQRERPRLLRDASLFTIIPTIVSAELIRWIEFDHYIDKCRHEYTCKRPTRVIYINIKKNRQLPKYKNNDMQNMNYGIYTNYKIQFRRFFVFFAKSSMYFGIFGLFCIINRYIEYRIRILCI